MCWLRYELNLIRKTIKPLIVSRQVLTPVSTPQPPLSLLKLSGGCIKNPFKSSLTMLQAPAEGNGRVPFISSRLKRSQVDLRVYNGVTEPHRVHDRAGVISFSDALHLHMHKRTSPHAHLVSASTQDKWRNERINKQEWKHTAPWEREHDLAATSVATRAE